MELNEYHKIAVSQRVYPKENNIIVPAFGVGEESGEVLGKIRKWLRGDDGGKQMSPERIEAIKTELGDVLWNIVNLSEDLGFTLEDVAKCNIEKINSRHERGVVHGAGDNR